MADEKDQKNKSSDKASEGTASPRLSQDEGAAAGGDTGAGLTGVGSTATTPVAEQVTAGNPKDVLGEDNKDPNLDEDGQNKTVENDEAYYKRNVAVEPKVPDAVLSRKNMTLAQKTRDTIMKEDTVMFMIPLAPGEPREATHEFQINGWTVLVKKGKFVPLPKTIAEIAANYYDIQMNAGEENLVDATPDRVDAIG